MTLRTYTLGIMMYSCIMDNAGYMYVYIYIYIYVYIINRIPGAASLGFTTAASCSWAGALSLLGIRGLFSGLVTGFMVEA